MKMALDPSRTIGKIEEAEETAQKLRREGWDDKNNYDGDFGFLTKIQLIEKGIERSLRFLLLNRKFRLFNFLHSEIKKERIKSITIGLDYYLKELMEHCSEARKIERAYSINPEESHVPTSTDYLEGALYSHKKLCYELASQLLWGEKPEDVLKLK